MEKERTDAKCQVLLVYWLAEVCLNPLLPSDLSMCCKFVVKCSVDERLARACEYCINVSEQYLSAAVPVAIG